MKAVNSDPDLKQYHQTNARFKALTLHRKIHQSKFRNVNIQDHQDTFFTGIQERRKIPYKCGKPSDDTQSSALRIGESRAQASTTPVLKPEDLLVLLSLSQMLDNPVGASAQAYRRRFIVDSGASFSHDS